MPRELRPCGTPAAYQRHRKNGEEPCFVCKLAHAERCARYYSPHPRRPKDRGDCAAPIHGDRFAYRAGCRCADALAAMAAERRRLRNAHVLGVPMVVPSLGSQRRIRALMALGWTEALIGAEMGFVTPSTIRGALRNATVTARTADRIAEVYERLSMRQGPSARTRMLAQRKGWLPPLAWDNIDDPNEHPVISAADEFVSVDMVAVQRRIAGDRSITLRLAERTAAYRLLYDRGLLDADIARAAGCDSETIGRWRRREGLLSNVLNERRFAS